MKLKMLLLLPLLLTTNTLLKAQVTIGSALDPQEGAILDLKETEMREDNTNASKGILFPKVALDGYDELTPLFEETTEPQATALTGVMVYNVSPSANGLDIGLHVWNGSEWIPLKGGNTTSSEQAELEIVTAEANIYGSLYKDISLTQSNIITLTVNVKKAGRYNMVATADPDNGYYYSATGEFLEPGEGLTVFLQGVGKPKQSTKDKKNVKDVIGLNVNGTSWGTLFTDVSVGEIRDMQANFTIDCGSVDISKVYLAETTVATGYIKVTITAPAEDAGKPYLIETDEKVGIYFSGMGSLSGGKQTVVLYPNKHMPENDGIMTFNFSSNSTVKPMCSFNVPVHGKAISVVVLGEINGGAWDIVGKKRERGVPMILRNQDIFGLAGLYPVDKIHLSQYYNMNKYIALNYDTVDVLIIAYNVNLENEVFVKKLIDYVNNKHGVIICCKESSQWNRTYGKKLLTGIFGAPLKTGTISDDMFTLTSNGNPVVKGVYSDLSGRKVGRDGGGNISFRDLPPAVRDSVIDIAVDQKGNPVVLMHKNKHFVLWGDGAPFNGGLPSLTSQRADIYPLQVDEQGNPMIRTHTKKYTEDTYNAHIFTNLMIWAFDYRLHLLE
jgi:hypothetical protein